MLFNKTSRAVAAIGASSLLMFLCSQCHAFVSPPIQPTGSTLSRIVDVKLQSKSINSEELNVDFEITSVTSSRRGWIGNMLKSGAVIALASNNQPASASVFIDPGKHVLNNLRM